MWSVPISCYDSLDCIVEVRLIYLETCKHNRHPPGRRPRGRRCGAPPQAPQKMRSKIAAAGHFEGVQLLNHSAPTGTTHVHLLPMVPSYNAVESIELNSQPGSRGRVFTAPNASISTHCRKMRFSAYILWHTSPSPGFNRFKRLV